MWYKIFVTLLQKIITVNSLTKDEQTDIMVHNEEEEQQIHEDIKTEIELDDAENEI